MCAFAEVAVRFWTGLAVRADAPAAGLAVRAEALAARLPGSLPLVAHFGGRGRAAPHHKPRVGSACPRVSVHSSEDFRWWDMFEYLSERARRILFLSHKNTGQRGASAIGVEDMIEALVHLDQDWRVSFFSRNDSAEILRQLAPLLQSGEPLAETAEIAVSPALQDVLTTAMGLRTELQHESVQPLHLLAAVLSEQSNVAEAVKRSGVTKEAVLAALGPGLPLPDSAGRDLSSRRTRPRRRW